jgi:hypothetical protein
MDVYIWIYGWMDVCMDVYMGYVWIGVERDR